MPVTPSVFCAVKIGMLSNRGVIEAVADGLKRHDAKTIVLDPVMVATSGDRLLKDDAIAALRDELFHLALVITPNLSEAAALTGASIAQNERDMQVQARHLLTAGAQNVLIKGGHGEGTESVDILVGQRLDAVFRFSAPRVATKNTHGSGCTLSSAIAAGLAKGVDLINAVQGAKDYVSLAIAAANDIQIGHGHGPLHHFHASWRKP